MVDISLKRYSSVYYSFVINNNTDHTDVLEMLKLIKDDSELIKVFEDQSFIWWNQPNVIKFITFIEDLIGKYISYIYIYNSRCLYKSDRQPKRELLELIDSC
jgi:hypothetical protein